MILPQFPLRLVAFPREHLALHIFEERYQILIKECKAKNSTFGIIPYIGNRLAEHGTEMMITDIVKEYDNGTMDIRCLAGRIYAVNNYTEVDRSQGYSYAIVEFLNSAEVATTATSLPLYEALMEMTDIMGDRYALKLDVNDLHSSDFVHKLGLDAETEMELLMLLNEDLRQQKLTKMVRSIVNHMGKTEEIKRRIQLNGHFKRLDPLDL